MHPNPTSRRVSDSTLPPLLTDTPSASAGSQRDFFKLQVRTCRLDKASVAPQCVWDRVQTPPLMSKQEHPCLPLWRLRPPIYFQPLCLSPIRFFPIPELTAHSPHWSCSLFPSFPVSSSSVFKKSAPMSPLPGHSPLTYYTCAHVHTLPRTHLMLHRHHPPCLQNRTIFVSNITNTQWYQHLIYSREVGEMFGGSITKLMLCMRVKTRIFLLKRVEKAVWKGSSHHAVLPGDSRTTGWERLTKLLFLPSLHTWHIMVFPKDCRKVFIAARSHRFCQIINPQHIYNKTLKQPNVCCCSKLPQWRFISWGAKRSFP